MTVPANLNRVDYTGTGSAGPFTVPFPFYDASHLTVLQTDALFNQTTLTGWTATGAGGPSGAVTLAAACPVGSTLTIMRIVPLTQITSIKNQEAFYPEVHEQEMDLLAMADQQLDEAMDRTLRLPAGLSGVNMTLPRPDPGHSLVWDPTGTALVNGAVASADLQTDLADSADVAKGDEMIAVKQPFAGAVARTQHDKNAEWVSVADFGAVGDGITDDTLAIQTAIKTCFDNGITKLEFEPGKIYRIDIAESQNSLVFYGKNLLVEGNGCTIKRYNTTGGYWGDLIDIIGLQNGINYPISGTYGGSNSAAENIVFQNFTLESDSTVVGPCNNIGITFAKNIIIKNVISKAAPACNFSAVNVDVNLPTENIKYIDCISDSGKSHGFSSQQWGGGNALSITYERCIARNHGSGVSEYEAETLGRKIHLWLRQGASSEKTYVEAIDCEFDNTAQIYASSYMSNLKFINCKLCGGISIVSTRGDYNSALFENCYFGASYLKVGATTEEPVYLKETKNIIFNNCQFSGTLNASFASGTYTISCYSVDNLIINNCTGINIVLNKNTDYNKNIKITNSEIAINSKQTSANVNFRLTFLYNSLVNSCIFKNIYIYFADVSETTFSNNIMETNYDTGYDLIRTGSNVNKNSIQNNQMRLVSPMVNYRKWISDRTVNVVSGNVTIQTSGVLHSDIVVRSSAPDTGYWFIGDRVINSVPTVGQPRSWVCTVEGPPVTWVSEGNL